MRVGLGLDVGLVTGRVEQIPPDLPTKNQIRVERVKERKQSFLENYFTGNAGTVTTHTVSEADNVPAIGLGPRSTTKQEEKCIGRLANEG